jgi:hypothetical protein
MLTTCALLVTTTAAAREWETRTVYRLTPERYTGLADMNSGDNPASHGRGQRHSVDAGRAALL